MTSSNESSKIAPLEMKIWLRPWATFQYHVTTSSQTGDFSYASK